MNDDMPAAEEPPLKIGASRLFPVWLASVRASLAFTTYQAGKLFMIGLTPEGRLAVHERSFRRCMGLGVGADRTLWMASLYQLWRFADFLDPGARHEGHDALFVPVLGHTTGDIDIHDIHEDSEGRPIFVATRLSCLATVSTRGSFVPLWRPPFIDRIVAEDRCHLNGLAMVDGRPGYATCLARSNVAGGWRERRRDGGMVLDVASGEAVATGLSMPHSPRLHDGRLWIIQSGTGEFGEVELGTGRFQPLCFLPGYARGMTFLGGKAVIGLSRPRRDGSFSGLPLDERLAREGRAARCGLAIVDLATGAVEHELWIEGVVEELYDVAALRGVIRPMALGFKTDEIRFMIRPAAS